MYTNWQKQGLDSFTAIRWYRVDKVIQYLHDLRRYIVCTPGKMSSAYMPMLQKEDSPIYDDYEQVEQQDPDMLQQEQQDNEHLPGLPAKENQRFPSHDIYICEAIGEWGLKLDRLALMSNIMVNTNRLERRYPHVDTVGELEEQGLAMIYELMRMIADRVDFVNRQQFEARYNLNWQEEQEQTPQQNSTAESSSNANHTIKREETSRQDTTGSPSNTPPSTSTSTDPLDGTVDLTSSRSN